MGKPLETGRPAQSQPGQCGRSFTITAGDNNLHAIPEAAGDSGTEDASQGGVRGGFGELRGDAVPQRWQQLEQGESAKPGPPPLELSTGAYLAAREGRWDPGPAPAVSVCTGSRPALGVSALDQALATLSARSPSATQVCPGRMDSVCPGPLTLGFRAGNPEAPNIRA